MFFRFAFFGSLMQMLSLGSAVCFLNGVSIKLMSQRRCGYTKYVI